MSHNYQNFAKFQKFQLENLVDFEKRCKTHIFLQKIGADTAENEQHFAEILPTDGADGRPEEGLRPLAGRAA